MRPDELRLFIPPLHAQAALVCRDAQLPIAQLPHQVKRLHRRLPPRQLQRVRLHLLRHRFTHVLRRPEIPVGRQQVFDSLVRPLEVVSVDEEAQPPLAILVVRKHRPREKLLPQRLPEALHLPERLRMLRPALHVTDPVAPQLLLEFRRPAPGRVLPPLIRQHLARHPILRNSLLQRFHHQRRLLLPRQRPPDDESRVVVHEDRQIDALMPAQQKREDVRLPELVRLGPLEAPLRLLPRRGWLLLFEHSFLVENPPHLRLAHADRLEPLEHRADLPRAIFGVRHLCCFHRLALRLRRILRFRLLSRRARPQRFLPSGRVQLLPSMHALPRQPKSLRDVRHPAAILQCLHHQPTEFITPLVRPWRCSCRTALLLARRHLSAPFASVCPAGAGSLC